MKYTLIATKSVDGTEITTTIKGIDHADIDARTKLYIGLGYKVRIENPSGNITHTDVLRFYNEHINTTAELTLSDVVNYFNRPVRESEGGC